MRVCVCAWNVFWNHQAYSSTVYPWDLVNLTMLKFPHMLQHNFAIILAAEVESTRNHKMNYGTDPKKQISEHCFVHNYLGFIYIYIYNKCLYWLWFRSEGMRILLHFVIQWSVPFQLVFFMLIFSSFCTVSIYCIFKLSSSGSCSVEENQP